MNRRLVLALALAGLFAAPLSAAYADSHDEEKKPERPQSIVGQSDEKETPKPELISQQDDDQPKKPEKPDYAA